MSEKKIYLGICPISFLAGFSLAFNLDQVKISKKAVDIFSIFYSCMLQSGAQSFEVYYTHMASESKYPFLKNRISSSSHKNPFKIYSLVRNVFRKYSHNYTSSANNNNITTHRHIEYLTEMFISDLLIAMDTGCNIVAMPKIPSEKKIFNFFHPEIAIPICNLIRSFKVITLDLPSPKSSISAIELEIFREIFDGKDYEKYSEAQHLLDLNTVPVEKAKSNILKSGLTIFQKHTDIINLKNISLSLIPLATNVVNKVFGGLLGVLAEHAGYLAEKMLKNEKRIVVYEFDQILNRLVSQQIEEKYNLF